MRQVITLQKIASMRGENVTGYEEKSFAKRIFGADQGLIEVLAIQLGHFHVADDESVIFAGCALEGFTGIEENVDAQTFILEDVGDKARNRGLVLQHKEAGTGPGTKCGTGMGGFG